MSDITASSTTSGTVSSNGSSTSSSTSSSTGLAPGALIDPDDLGLTETSLPTGSKVRTWWWRELRPLLLRVHFYAGLFVGPFLLVSALTGLLYTTTPQLEQLVHRDQLHVTAPAGAAALPLSQQINAASAVLPEGSISEIRPPIGPDGTTRVVFNAPGVPDGYFRTVFVDPYTAQVRDTLTTYGQWLPVRAWFDELHRTLFLGNVGRVYSELSASWLWVLTLSGLVIWVARRRRTRRLRRLLTPRLRGTGRGRLRSWHGAVGVWAAVGFLFLSATGLTWSQFAGNNVDTLRGALQWTTPSVHTTISASVLPDPPKGAELAEQAERALAVARAHGLTDPVRIAPPTKPGRAWVVIQVKRSWPEKQDSMAIDPTTGTVVDQLRFADWPLAAKLARWGVDAHMGLLFGLPSQIALAALAIGLICMITWGYRMWWLRRPTRLAESPRAGESPWALAPPGRRWSGLGAIALLGAVAVGVGLFLPVFGASLLVFLLIDAIRTEFASARA